MGALDECFAARLHVGALLVIVLAKVGALHAVDAQVACRTLKLQATLHAALGCSCACTAVPCES
eukprot:6919431-Alexandrium_andersonii.AAC.1